jgi:hypothetical protein
MYRKRNAFKVAATQAFILFLFLAAPAFVMGKEDPERPDEPIKIIVWSDGRWIYVDSVQEKYGSIIYQKPGGRPVAATEYALDKKTTLDVNRAFEVFFDACAGKSTNLTELFELKGRTEQLFFSIAGKHSSECFQRLHQDFQQDLAADEATKRSLSSKRRISDVAGEIALKKSEGVSTGQSLSSPAENQGPDVSSLLDGNGKLHLTDQTDQAVFSITDEYVAHVNRSQPRAEELVFVGFTEESIKEHCAKRTPDDFSSQAWCVKRWAEMAERTAENAGVEPEVFAAIRAKCAQKWP